MPGIEAIPVLRHDFPVQNPQRLLPGIQPLVLHHSIREFAIARGCNLKFLPEAAVTFAVTLYQGTGHHPSWELGLFIPELPQSRRWHRLVLATCCCSFQLNLNLS